MKNEVIITGAGRGIGLSLVKKFSACGWKVIAISRNVQHLNELPGVEVVSGDLTDSHFLEGFISKMNSQGKAAFRVLINNAGVLLNKPFEEISSAEFKAMMAINYEVPFRLTQGLIPWAGQSDKAHVLFIGSMGGFQGSSRYPGLSLYSSLKSAQASLGESLASEFSDSHIHFNTLCLGAVDTEMLQEAFPGYASGVSPAQVSDFIFEFANNAYSLFNGKVIPVSGSNP